MPEISPESHNMILNSLALCNIDQRTGEKNVHSTLGIPGAGKSTFVANMIRDGNFPKTYFLLNPDSIMESLPEYQSDIRSYGREEAFHKWEEYCVQMGYMLLEKAIESEFDIVIDMGMARPESYELLYRLKSQHGYKVNLYWINTPINVALERISKRERYTPPQMVLERAANLSILRPKYELIADHFHIVSCSNAKADLESITKDE